jgi:acetyl esterase/lipase
MPGWTTERRAWTGSRTLTILQVVLLISALGLAFLAAWVVVPAPTLLWLPLGVGAPEVSPLLSASCLAVAALAAVVPRLLARVAAAVALIGTLVSAIPLLQLPGSLRAFDAALAALHLPGETTLAQPPDARGRAFSPRDLLFGVDRGRSVAHRGVVVGEAGGRPLVADLYARDGSTAAPVIVQIYGGAWQRGSPGDDEPFARYFAARGYLVAAIDYRHAPAARWPAQIEDVRTALAWLRLHAGEYGGDGARLALVGRSAGAQLALVAAYEAGAKVAGVVSFYGPVYLADGWRVPPRPDPLGVRGVLETYLGGTPDQVPDRYGAASPVTYVSAAAPPTLLVYGSRDHIVEARFARRLEAELRRAGAPVALLELPWAEHAFDAVPNGLGAQVALYYAERFLARVLR